MVRIWWNKSNANPESYENANVDIFETRTRLICLTSYFWHFSPKKCQCILNAYVLNACPQSKCYVNGYSTLYLSDTNFNFLLQPNPAHSFSLFLTSLVGEKGEWVATWPVSDKCEMYQDNGRHCARKSNFVLFQVWACRGTRCQLCWTPFEDLF